MYYDIIKDSLITLMTIISSLNIMIYLAHCVLLLFLQTLNILLQVVYQLILSVSLQILIFT